MSDIDHTSELSPEVAAAWAEVADVLGESVAATPVGMPLADPAMPQANLAMALRSIHRRKELRRFLIVLGAVVPGQPEPGSRDGNADTLSTAQLVGRLMTLDAGPLERMIRRAGMITSDDRIIDFARQIAAEAGQHDPTDPVAVHVWIGRVGAILRAQA